MRKRIVWTAAIFFTAGLTACDGESTSGRARQLAAAAKSGPPLVQTTITALVWAPDWPDQMHRLAQAFTAENPDVAVEVQFMIGNSVEENVKPKVASNNFPDIVSLNPNAYAGQLADMGVLADVGGTRAWHNMLEPLKAEWTSSSGKQFGIAGGVAAGVIYYNKALFEQAGINAPPDNFDAFLAVCEKLKHAGITPLSWSGGFPNVLANGPFSAGFANNVVANDADWKNKIADGSLDLDRPEVADIFNKIKLLPMKGYTQPDYMATGYDDGIALFREGKVAMAFLGTWAAGALTRDKKFEVGVFIPPWNASGTEVVPVLGSETGFAVGATAHRDAALRFLEFMYGRGLAIQQGERHNIVPIKDPAPELQSDSTVWNYVHAIQGKPRIAEPYYAYLPSNTMNMLHPLLQDVLLGRKSPQQAATLLDRSVKNEAMREHK